MSSACLSSCLLHLEICLHLASCILCLSQGLSSTITLVSAIRQIGYVSSLKLVLGDLITAVCGLRMRSPTWATRDKRSGSTVVGRMRKIGSQEYRRIGIYLSGTLFPFDNCSIITLLCLTLLTFALACLTMPPFLCGDILLLSTSLSNLPS